MSSRVLAVVIDADDPLALARFWSSVLGGGEPFTWEDAVGKRYVEFAGEPSLLFQPVPEAKNGRNRLHLDIAPTSSTQEAEVVRLTNLGASIVDDAAGFPWVVCADPEGNEFCVLPPADGS